MWGAPVVIGDLDLRSLAITCRVQDILHLISLFINYVPSKSLLTAAIEYH